MSTDDAWVPTIADLSYPGGRFEREIRDLFGVEPRDHPLPRRLVRHAHWPRAWHPLLGARSPQTDAVPDFGEDLSTFPFLEVGGDGVYEIPVGPVHAGLIEPGHFRFSVVGETIVRMKARLWYLHRGVERLFEGRTPDDGVVLAERISGDTAVGHTLAYALACEEALGLVVPPRDQVVRALLLELERMHNHAADLGMILNDVAFGLANVHLQRVRENLLRLNESVTGHRLLRGGVRSAARTSSRCPAAMRCGRPPRTSRRSSGSRSSTRWCSTGSSPPRSCAARTPCGRARSATSHGPAGSTSTPDGTTRSSTRQPCRPVRRPPS